MYICCFTRIRKNFQFVHWVGNTGKSSDKKLLNKILRKFEREKEIVDLSLVPTLPSCEANVEYHHIMLTEYAALIFRNIKRLTLNLEVPVTWRG